MTSVFIKQTAGFGKGLLIGAGRWNPLKCVSCLTISGAITYRHERSCKHFKPDRTLCDEAEISWERAVYKPKYLIFLSDLTQAATALSNKNPLRFSHHRELLVSQHVFSSNYVILYNRYLSHTNYQHFQCRHLHISPSWRKEESKLEKTVKALRDYAIEKKGMPTVKEAAVALTSAKKSPQQRFVAFCMHYYHGFRLLAIDVEISCKLLGSLLLGKSLTRREHTQLVRTTADMFRLVPLLVFIVVPFAEFLLPVVLMFFPNILPSTFQDPKDEKEKIKKTLKAKLEMARFLQKTIHESPVQAKNQDGQTVESFSLFIDKIRKEGTKPKTKDIMKFAKLFEDEITLDNLTRSQLRACCIILNITPIGSDALLRFILQMKLRSLQADDKMIQKEGLDSLNISELQAANRARGMRALGVSEERLREQMQQWLQLHLKEKIPTSLLLLSRALYLPENLSTEEKLGATITKLAVTASDEAKVKVAEMSGEAVDNKTKFEMIKHEEAIIALEKDQLAKEIKLIEEQSIRDQAEAKAAEPKIEELLVDKAKILESYPNETLVDNAKVVQTSASEILKLEKAAQITAKDLDDMESVLAEIAKERRLDIEHNALKGLKEEISEYKEDLEVLKDVASSNGEKEKQYQESPAARHLAKTVDRMISRLDPVMVGLQEEKTSIQEKMSKEEESLVVKELGGAAQHSHEKIDNYKRNIVSINEMIDALKRLKKVPDDAKLQQVFRVLDQDKDGIIDINDALRVLELLSQENLKLNTTHLDEVLSLLKHEASMDEEERRKEKEEKERKENKL